MSSSHLSMSQVSATAASHPTSGSLGSSLTSVLHRSRSIGTSLLDLHLAVDHRLRAPHLYNTSQKTCRTHNFRHSRASHHSTYFVNYIDNHSSQNEHTKVLVNLVFTISILFEHYFRIIISLSHILSFRETECHWSSCILLGWYNNTIFLFQFCACLCFLRDQFICHSQDITFKKFRGNAWDILLVLIDLALFIDSLRHRIFRMF
jgi:hypothetical protein